MSIHLNIKAKDDEVENLLAYLQAQYNIPIEDKISLLERTLRWLRASTEDAYDLSVDSLDALQLTVDAAFAQVPAPVDTFSQPL
jgi:hypothetical protein